MAEGVVIHSSWHKCYKESWGKEIVPEAFSHPAKFARGLIRRIYAHALERGYLKEDDTVLDPFGGVALGALDAMSHGLHWVGVELEEKFVGLGQGYDCDGKVASEPDGKLIGARCGFMVDHDPHHVEGNIDLWNRRYGDGKLRRWGTAVILQGDSRRLCEVLEGARAEGIVASPPWTDSVNVMNETTARKYDGWAKNKDGSNRLAKSLLGDGYGTSPAQLGNMPTGEPPQAVIASPPYSGSQVEGTTSGRMGNGKRGHHWSKVVTTHDSGYGNADGQLAALPEGEPPQVDGIIASPPYARSMDDRSRGSGIDDSKMRHERGKRKYQRHGNLSDEAAYGNTDGQIGAMKEGDAPSTLKERLEMSILRALRKGLPPQMIISSPPYTGSISGNEATYPELRDDGDTFRPGQSLGKVYSADARNLGNMREGEPPSAVTMRCPHCGSPLDDEESKGESFLCGGCGETVEYVNKGKPPAGIVQVDACVSSPPYEGNPRAVDKLDGKHLTVRTNPRHPGEKLYFTNYAQQDSEGNLGNQQGETFWSAARAILLQCHAVLAPGGVAIWIVKDFVRNKKRVDFTGQWRALCESCGFETIEIIRAWLVEERGTQYDLKGETHTKTVERKSFFRRLYEFKARAAKFWELVNRDDKASYLRDAHGELWRDYHRRVLEDESPPPLPTRTRILGAAQALAYREAGEPDVEIDTQIDYEVVLVMRKEEGKGTVQGIISSPPWMESGVNLGDVADTPGMRQEISNRSHSRQDSYGSTSGQLGNMKEGIPPT